MCTLCSLLFSRQNISQQPHISTQSPSFSHNWHWMNYSSNWYNKTSLATKWELSTSNHCGHNSYIISFYDSLQLQQLLDVGRGCFAPPPLTLEKLYAWWRARPSWELAIWSIRNFKGQTRFQARFPKLAQNFSYRSTRPKYSHHQLLCLYFQ